MGWLSQMVLLGGRTAQALAYRFAFAIGHQRVVHGIAVSVGSTRRGAADALARLERALDLVELYDARQHAIIQARLEWLLLGGLNRGGRAFYVAASRGCVLPLSLFDESRVSLAWLASVLLHEATHGRIHALGVSTTRTLRPRIERLCLRTQLEFLNRVPDAGPERAHLQSCIRSLDPAGG